LQNIKDSETQTHTQTKRVIFLICKKALISQQERDKLIIPIKKGKRKQIEGWWSGSNGRVPA
jgi:hypothetical protein